MRAGKFWTRTIGLSVTVAFVFSLAIALVTATAALAAGLKEVPNSTPQAVSGVLTDSRCGARHPRNSGMSVSECTRFCIKQGASWALVDGDAAYTLKGDSPDYDRLAGERVKVTGEIDGNRIEVQSIETLRP